MAILKESLTWVAERREEQLRRLRYQALEICGRLEVTQIDLSAAMGLYAPLPGQSGLAAVTAWMRGENGISIEHQAVIEGLHEGALGLRLVSWGRRASYDITTADAVDQSQKVFDREALLEEKGNWELSVIELIPEEDRSLFYDAVVMHCTEMKVHVWLHFSKVDMGKKQSWIKAIRKAFIHDCDVSFPSFKWPR